MLQTKYLENQSGLIARVTAPVFPPSYLANYTEVTEGEWLQSMQGPPLPVIPPTPEEVSARQKLIVLGFTDEEADVILG